ncbi:MAG: amidohydrolase family protein [Ilumatobacteraceae bacterium]
MTNPAPPTGSRRFVADHLVRSADLPVVSPGVVDVVDDTVVWSGASADAPAVDGPTTAVPGLLVPGFVNTHAHTPMLLLRGTGEGLPTDRWLVEVMWPREGRLEADDVTWAMRLGAAELLTNGITTTNEMYFYGAEVAAASAEAGLRCSITAPVIEAEDFSKFGSVGDQLDRITAMRSEWRDDPLIDVGIGPHAAYSLSRRALEAVADFVAADPMLLHIHVAEQPNEGDGVLSEWGLSVPAYLEELGLLGPRTIAAHCVWMSRDDIEIFARLGVNVAHCPASNGRHASGMAPIAEMLDAGITVGLGTDGPASHDRLDLFENMRAATWFARLRAMDAAAMPARDVFAMATTAAGRAIGRPDLGHLLPGARADMLRVDVEAPHVEPLLDPEQLIERFVWAGSPGAVRDVWVGARRVVADGDCMTVDVAEARQQVAARARRLVEG